MEPSLASRRNKLVGVLKRLTAWDLGIVCSEPPLPQINWVTLVKSLALFFHLIDIYWASVMCQAVSAY